MLVGDLVVVEDDLAVVLRLLAPAAAGRVRRLHAGQCGGHPSGFRDRVASSSPVRVWSLWCQSLKVLKVRKRFGRKVWFKCFANVEVPSCRKLIFKWDVVPLLGFISVVSEKSFFC